MLIISGFGLIKMDSYGSTWGNAKKLHLRKLEAFQVASHGASHHWECTKAMELWKVSSSESPAKANLDSVMASWKKTSLAT